MTRKTTLHTPLEANTHSEGMTSSDLKLYVPGATNRKFLKQGGQLLGTPFTRSETTLIDAFDLFIKGRLFLDKQVFCNFLNSFRLEIERQERVCTRMELLQKLVKIRDLAATSPFINRAQSWPRGYQGDFETIDYIINGENKAEVGTFGYVLEDYFLQSAICEQHKNKIERQMQLITEAVAQKSHAKVISIGCGSSEDVKRCIPVLKQSQAEITLVDVDQDAIAFSLHRLTEIKERLILLHGNIYKVMRSLNKHYELILIGGVFDYLNDKTIVSVLRSLQNNLSETGTLFFTNIVNGNPYRVFMEYFSNWMLIERSKADIARLIREAQWPDNGYRIRKDKTGLTHLVELSIHKP